MSIWQKNLEALSKSNPKLAARLQNVAPSSQARVQPARRVGITATVEGQRMASGVDPVAEGLSAAKSAPAGPLLVLGFGLGYHLEPLLGRDMLVFEPDLAFLRLVLESRDLSPLLAVIKIEAASEALAGVKGRSLWCHRPTARRYPGAETAMAGLLAGDILQKPRPKQPKVMVIPPIFGGSQPIAGWCARALQQLGCKVHLMPTEKAWPMYEHLRKLPNYTTDSGRITQPLVRSLSEWALVEAELFHPDLVMIMAQAPIDQKGQQGIKALGVTTAYWFVENFRVMSYFKRMAPHFDYFFHIQPGELERILDSVGANHHFLPMAANPEVHRPLDLTLQDKARYGAQVGFMGEAYPNRRVFFSRLHEMGLDFRLWGTGWQNVPALAARLFEDGRRLSTEEVVKVYNACDITINLHSSPQQGDRVGSADFLNPRTFEVCACGGFQLVDNLSGMPDFFRPDREIAVFDNDADLVEKACWYLAHPEERKEIAENGRQRVLNEHTYYHRMEKLLTICLGPGDNLAEEKALSPTSIMQEQGTLTRRQALSLILDEF